MKKIFEFLTIFDWVTPLAGFVDDIVNDPSPFHSNSWTFFIPYEQSLQGGWNALNVEDLLRQHGIKTWGRQITNGELFFSVNLDKAQWAEYILWRNKIPIATLSQGAPRPNKKKNASTSKRSNNGPDLLTQFLNDFLIDEPPRSSSSKRKKPTHDPLSSIDDFLDKWF